MDISVRNLNNRLALQLPTQLPLGLVFVTGEIEALEQPSKEVEPVDPFAVTRFKLVEGAHSLRCQLTRRATAHETLREGDRVRAGGHLVFDPLEADYYLLARDLEIIGQNAGPTMSHKPANGPVRKPLKTPDISDLIPAPSSTDLTPADLPAWVQQISPAMATSENSSATAGPDALQDSLLTPEDDDWKATVQASGLREALVKQLDRALSSEEEMEITAAMAAELAPALDNAIPGNLPPMLRNRTEVTSTRAARLTRSPAYARSQRRGTDWLVIVLILAFFIFTVAVIIGSVLLLLQ